MYWTVLKVGVLSMLVDINLLPKKEKKKSYVWLFFILFLAVVALGSVYLFQLYNNQLATKQKLQSELTNLKVEKVTLESKAMKSESENAEEKLTAAIKWADENQYSTYSFLGKISSLLPERGFIMNFAFQNDGAAALSVQFDSTRESAFYLKSLSKADFIKNVELVNIQTDKLESDTVVNNNEVLPRYTANYQLQVDTTKLKQEGAK